MTSAASSATLSTKVAWHAKYRPNHPAVVDGKLTLSYGELDRRARAVAAGLRAQGVARGDVVSVQLPNTADFVVMAVAAAHGGMVLGPLSPRFGLPEVGHVVSRSASRVLVYNRDDNSAVAEAIAADRPDLLRVVAGGRPARSGELPLVDLDGPGADLRAGVGLDEPAVALHSSGTEGLPKLPLHTERSLMHCTTAVAERNHLTPADRFLVAVPITTGTGTHGMVHCALVVGATLVMMPAWDPRTAAALVAEHRCTYSIAPTTMLFDLLNDPAVSHDQLDSLRVFTCGGSPIPSEVVEHAADELSLVVSPMYGSTECLAATNGHPDDPPELLSGSDGPALLGVDIAIAGPDGAILGPGEAGQILVGGPTLFQGYLGQPERTAQALAGGWYRTGDVGRLDKDGYLRVIDRISDIIIRGGTNISSKDVENDLLAHPDIAEVAVVAAPDDRLGERIAAFVVARSGAVAPTFEDVLQVLEDRGVARYRWPERLDVLPGLPRNSSGKVQKAVLRQRLREEVGS
ncbi:Long-chain-fatty-acid--CoA ligase [Euzebya pacifica]|uniref:Long-chain-fatty-acid--CoA ligase n=1 Tax=Euzebya pacifica TaxID=1608957 RepID=A0A346XWS3_9ACTN|nr:AMP-binding protein [Euzebya pacifica]AXV06670.1 Long-chain-fatty-acid--CoA ligase [Euzebya pacifica]